MKSLFFILVSIVTCQLSLVSPAFAQTINNPQGLAVNVEISDSDVVEGNIISATKDGYKKATIAYDAAIYGVVVNAPILSVKAKSDSTKAVVTSGEANVLVSTANGEIKQGDFITSSTTAGVGVKAAAPGYILGKALVPYSDSSKPGTIAVLVNIGYSGGAGGGASSLIAQVTNPKNSRYVLGAIVAILLVVSLTIAFIRLVSSGITAIGRNPLAKSTIMRGMVIAGLVIVLVGIAGAGAVLAIMNKL